MVISSDTYAHYYRTILQSLSNQQATTIFSHVASALFGQSGERYGAVVLTAVTLFFVELLPKSIGVASAEKVARYVRMCTKGDDFENFDAFIR